MSDRSLPDLSWTKSCNKDLLEEALLVLEELAAEFDAGTSRPRVAARRKLPSHKQPMVGGTDPYGGLRSRALQMLRYRGVIDAYEQEGASSWAVNADEAVVRGTLSAMRQGLLPDPAGVVDTTWTVGFDRGLLDGCLVVLKDIKFHLDSEDQPLTISRHGPTQYDLKPHPDDADRMVAYRERILRVLATHRAIKSWSPIDGKYGSVERFLIDADRKAVEDTLAAVKAALLSRAQILNIRDTITPTRVPEATEAKPDKVPAFESLPKNSRNALPTPVNTGQAQTPERIPVETEIQKIIAGPCEPDIFWHKFNSRMGDLTAWVVMLIVLSGLVGLAFWRIPGFGEWFIRVVAAIAKSGK